MPAITALVPKAGTRKTNSVDAVVPERVAVTFALYDDHRYLGPEAPHAIKEWFGAAPPAEAIVAGLALLQRDAEANCWLSSGGIPIKDPQGRGALIGNVREPELLEERFR
jgi:hypothetical protein